MYLKVIGVKNRLPISNLIAERKDKDLNMLLGTVATIATATKKHFTITGNHKAKIHTTIIQDLPSFSPRNMDSFYLNASE